MPDKSITQASAGGTSTTQNAIELFKHGLLNTREILKDTKNFRPEAVEVAKQMTTSQPK